MSPVRVLASVVLALSLACAGAPPRAPGAPVRVVMVGAAVVNKPPPQGLVGDVFGSDTPREVVARAGAEALRSRGFEVLGVEGVGGPAPTVEQAAAIARRYGAEAAVVLVLTRLDLSALRPLGQVEVELESLMVGPAGQVWTRQERHGTTTERLYRAQTDWRSHVRQAVIQSVRELP